MTSQADDVREVRHSPWRDDGEAARLWCPTCGYATRGKRATVIAAGVRHVKKHGHRVQVYRHQRKAISPVREEAPE
jgi:hypothetical protein